MNTLKSKLARITKEINQLEGKSCVSTEVRTLAIEMLKKEKSLLRKDHIEKKKGR